jgi:predicted AlkP superfamily pyrophosphatase or phosphodiesterase
LSQKGEEKPMSWTERFLTDRFAIIIFILTIASIPLLYWILSGTTSYSDLKQKLGTIIDYIWVILAPIPNIIYSVAKTLRQTILFRSSRATVKAKEGPKVLLWILDGCNVQAFLDVAAKNHDLKTMFEEGYFAQCATIFPSITPAAHTSLLTGCYPYRTRIPAFDWVETVKGYNSNEFRTYHRVMPDYKRLQTEGSSEKYQKQFFKDLGDALDLNQRILSPMVYTIYETLGEDWYTVSIKEWIHRGADNFIGESVNASIQDLAKKNVISKSSMLGFLDAIFKEVSYEFGGIIWGADSFRMLPDLMVYWKTGTDTVSHEYGPRASQVRDEVDEAIGKLADTIRFYKMYSNQPIYVFITSDHSQSEVTRYSGLVSEFKDEMSQKYKVVGREDRELTDKVNAADIIVANNDRAAFFYLFGDEKVKVSKRDDVIAYLKGREEVDLIIFRDEGKSKAIQLKNDNVPQESVDVVDFFKGREDDYPNGVERVEGLLRGGDWGDVVVSMKEGFSLNPDFKPVVQSEEILRGDHGGMNRSDSISPLLAWGPTIRKNVKGGCWKTFRMVDITPTIVSIFKTQQMPTDGRVLEEIFL